jgi:hypothetical protein
MSTAAGDVPPSTVFVAELQTLKASLLKALGQDENATSITTNGDATSDQKDTPAIAPDFQRAIEILTILQQRSPQIVNVATLSATKYVAHFCLNPPLPTTPTNNNNNHIV